MRVLIGYLINGKSSGIDKYVLRMLDTLQDQKIQFDCLTTEKTEELEDLIPVGIQTALPKITWTDGSNLPEKVTVSYKGQTVESKVAWDKSSYHCHR